MNARGTWAAFFTVILLLSLSTPFVTPVLAESPSSIGDSVSGAAIPLPPEKEQTYLDDMSDWTGSSVVSDKAHAYTLMTESRIWVVYTDEKPEAGEVTVKGTVVAKRDEVGVLFANNRTATNEATQASISDVRENPGKYAFGLVEITGNYGQLAYSVDTTDGIKSEQTETGILTTGQFFSDGFGLQPGQTGRWSTLNLSSNQLGGDRSGDVLSRMLYSGDGLLVFGRSEQFSMNSTATVTVLVLTRAPGSLPSSTSESNRPTLYLVDTEPQSTSVETVQEINERGESLAGEVVTVDAQAVGARTSSKEFLLSTAKCAPESVTVPVVPPGCVPVVTDSIVHSGVLFDGSESINQGGIAFTGLSNHIQQEVTQPIAGEYRITGRVRNISEVDSSLSGDYVLIVYEMERIGDLLAEESIKSQAQKRAEKVEHQMKAQLNNSATVESRPNQKATDTDATTATTTATTTADRDSVFVTDAWLPDEQIRSNETAVVKATVRNYADNPATKIIKLKIGYQEIQQKQVRVPANTKKQIQFTYEPRPHQTMAKLRIGTETAGKLQIERVDNQDTTSSSIQSTNSISLLPIGLGFLGVVFTISAIITGIVWLIKAYKPAATPKTSKWTLLSLGVAGIVSLLSTGYLLQSKLILLTTGGLLGTALFISGWLWALDMLWRSG